MTGHQLGPDAYNVFDASACGVGGGGVADNDNDHAHASYAL